jgi:Zn-dependent protease with chaperone function
VDGWRLGIPAPVPPEIQALLPPKERYGRWIDRIGLAPALAAGLLISAALIFLGARSPEWLAPLVPQAWEDRYGDALVGDFGGRFCNTPAGSRALSSLAARLGPDAASLNIRVVNIKMVNAAALPGGNIVLFQGLLDEAEGPDEVAGVLAHEVAHVENRHVTETMIRHMGFGLLLSAFGGPVGGNIETVLSAGYSRGAETEADEGAIEALRRAGISPLATAGFFARLGRVEASLGRVGEGLAYLSTHPVSKERERRFKASARPGASYRPALTPAEWRALKSMCAARR